MALPPASYDLIVHMLQSNFPSHATNGAYRQWYGDTISVYIANMIMPDDADNNELDGWVGMGVNQYQAALDAFRMWDEIIGVSISLTTDNEDANITFGYSTTTESDGTYASPEIGALVSDIGYGTYEIEDQDIWMSADNWMSLTEQNIGIVGTGGFLTFLHEIGHSLGLSHTGQYNASDPIPPDYSEDAEFPEDTGQYSIMSYFGNYYIQGSGWAPPDNDTPVPGGLWTYWQTPTMYDMLAAQSKYGAELTTRADNTTYGYNASGVGVWSKIYDFSVNTTPLITIYDAGGIDTIDLSDFSAGAQIVDLRQGAYSDVLGMTNNLAIAYSTDIENAIGGGGIDRITGNDLANSLAGNAGDDAIYGGNGIDHLDGGADNDLLDAGGSGHGIGTETLTGGMGDDTFVYSRGYRHSVITDFNVTTDDDFLDISRQTIYNFVDLMAAATQVDADTVIDFGNATAGVSDKLTLQNFDLDDLDSSRFNFTETSVSAPGDFLAFENPGASNFVSFYSTGAAFADGFMMVETSITTYNGSHALMAHRFDERGVETGTFQVNTTAFNVSGLWARALTLANGNVAVIWMSDDPGGGGDFCFRGRIFDENGDPVTANDFVVNSTPPVAQTNPNGWSMDIFNVFNSTSGNGFIVGWRKDVVPGDAAGQIRYFERAFDNSGNPLTSDIDVGAIGTPGVPGYPLQNALKEVVLSSGKVLHWWTDFEPRDPNGGLKIMARFSGDEGYVVVGGNRFSQPVSADELSDGNIVFNWAHAGGAQVSILDSDLLGFVRSGTGGNETLTGGIYNDELYGLGGDDKLIGGREADILDGGEGNDTVDYGGSIEGVDINLSSLLSQGGGHAEGDKLISIENVMGSGADDVFRDNEGNNYLFGSYGKDRFVVSGGNDTVDGGRGRDSIVYENGIDECIITYDATNQKLTIVDARTGSPNGTDTVSNVEQFIFGGLPYSFQEVLDYAEAHADHPVTAEIDSYGVTVGTVFTCAAEHGLLVNDSIPDGGGKVLGVLWDGEYVMSVDDPFFGTITVAEDGSFTFFAPDSSIYTFVYGVQDANGSVATSYVNLTAEPPANSAPSGTDHVITIDEDQTYQLKTADFGFSDSSNQFEAVIIGDITGAGGLTFNGNAVESGDQIDVANFANLVWTPTKDMNGTGLGGFTFQVVDDGGTSDESVDTDPTPNSLTFDVTEVTDLFKGKKGKETFLGTADHDVFDGKAGKDTFTGNGGSDTFVFKRGYDRDTILDFDATDDDHDMIDIRALSSVANWTDLRKNHLEVHGDDIWIDGGKGDVLVLKDVARVDVDKSHFMI